MHRQSAQRCCGTGRTEHEHNVRSGRKLGIEAETVSVLINRKPHPQLLPRREGSGMI